MPLKLFHVVQCQRNNSVSMSSTKQSDTVLIQCVFQAPLGQEMSADDIIVEQSTRYNGS